MDTPATQDITQLPVAWNRAMRRDWSLAEAWLLRELKRKGKRDDA